MSEKKIIACPHCKDMIRLPAKGHIHFKCPSCFTQFEFLDGEPIKKTSNLNEINTSNYTNTQKAPKKNTSYKYNIVILFLSVVLISIIIYSIIPKSPKVQEVEISKKNSPNNYNVELDTFKPQVNSVYKDNKDSLFNEQLKDFLKDRGEDLLDALFDAMKEEAENGEWEKANEWYEKTTETMKESGKWGTDFMKKHQSKFALTKNKIISKNPNQIKLPESKIIDKNELEGDFATELIRNATAFTVTLTYTGPINKTEWIPSMTNATITLPKGTYFIVARIPGIGDCSRTQTFSGFRYSGIYYIGSRSY